MKFFKGVLNAMTKVPALNGKNSFALLDHSTAVPTNQATFVWPLAELAPWKVFTIADSSSNANSARKSTVAEQVPVLARLILMQALNDYHQSLLGQGEGEAANKNATGYRQPNKSTANARYLHHIMP
jgi:hypothetical protein